MPTVAVGARELKTHLGAWLDRVRGGQHVVVTDRGVPVAELRPLSAEPDGLAERLARAELGGLLIRPAGNPLPTLRPISRRGLDLSGALDREDRV